MLKMVFLFFVLCAAACGSSNPDLYQGISQQCLVQHVCTVALKWQAPTTGPSVDGYRVHWGKSSGKYDQTLDVGNVTSTRIPGVTGGIYYFAVTDYLGQKESGYSNEIVLQVPPNLAALRSKKDSQSSNAWVY